MALECVACMNGTTRSLGSVFPKEDDNSGGQEGITGCRSVRLHTGFDLAGAKERSRRAARAKPCFALSLQIRHPVCSRNLPGHLLERKITDFAADAAGPSRPRDPHSTAV
jgi:hypothetical protein